MPAPPKREDPRPKQRRDQLEHGAQSDRGGDAYRPLSSREKEELEVYEGARARRSRASSAGRFLSRGP